MDLNMETLLSSKMLPGSPVLPSRQQLPHSIWHNGEGLSQPAAAMQRLDRCLKTVWTKETNQETATVDAVAPCQLPKWVQAPLQLVFRAATARLQQTFVGNAKDVL